MTSNGQRHRRRNGHFTSSKEEEQYYLTVGSNVDCKMNIMRTWQADHPQVFEGLREDETVEVLVERTEELKRLREQALFQTGPRFL